MFDALKQARRAGAAAKKAQKEQQGQPELQVPAPPAPMAKSDALSLPRSSKSLAELGQTLARESVSDQMHRLEKATAELSGQGMASVAAGQSERKLTIGTGIRLKGDISDCDSLLVEGQIEASVNANKVEIKEGGAIVGDAKIGIADISGHFEGALTVTEHLIIRSTGCVTGKVQYQAIVIEAGGRISGEIQAESPKSNGKASSPSPNVKTDRSEDNPGSGTEDGK